MLRIRVPLYQEVLLNQSLTQHIVDTAMPTTKGSNTPDAESILIPHVGVVPLRPLAEQTDFEFDKIIVGDDIINFESANKYQMTLPPNGHNNTNAR